MPDDIKPRPIGRVSEPSHNVAPAGSLLVAKNCAIREMGVVTAVPDLSTDISTNSVVASTFQSSPVFTNGTPEQLHRPVHIGTKTQYGVRKTSAMNLSILFTDPDGDSVGVECHSDDNSMPLRQPMYLQRDNLYVGDRRGLLKWQDTADATLEPIWDVEPARVTAGAGGAGWMADNDHVGYRTVVRFKDSNGVIRRSAPSQVWRYQNTSGGAVNPDITDLRMGAGYAVFGTAEAVEVYRTRSIGEAIALPNEYYLTIEIPISDFNANGIWQTANQEDSNDDTVLGAALYTNGSREGEAASNVAPPECLAHAHFNGSEFWGNVSELEVTRQINYAGAATNDFEHTKTGDFSSGTDTILNLSNTTSLELGQLIENANATAGTYITAISGSTVTMSANATGTATTSSTDFHDCIYIVYGDGETERLEVSRIFLNASSRGVLVDGVRTWVPFRQRTDELDEHNYPWSAVVAGVRRTARSGAAQFWVNKLSSFVDTDMADLNANSGAPTTGGTEFEPALHKSRIYWSKFQEPEHTTLLSFQDIGNTSGADGDIIALAATRDSLFIFKADGVWRLTGTNGNWRIDPFDRSVRVIGRDTVRVMDNAIYALSDQGVIRVTEGGVERLSDNIVGDFITERMDTLYGYYAEWGDWPPLLCAAVNQHTREYVLLLNTTTGAGTDGAENEMLVYNAKTGAWYTWQHLTTTTAPFASYLSYSPIGDYTQTASDGSNIPSLILGTFSGSEAEVLRMEPTPGTDETMDVQFRINPAGDPTHLKLWQDVVFDGERASAATGTVLAQFAAGDEDTAVSTVEITDEDGNEFRMWVPRAQARNAKLVAGISGTGLTIRGVRYRFTSSGREAPLG